MCEELVHKQCQWHLNATGRVCRENDFEIKRPRGRRAIQIKIPQTLCRGLSVGRPQVKCSRPSDPLCAVQRDACLQYFTGCRLFSGVIACYKNAWESRIIFKFAPQTDQQSKWFFESQTFISRPPHPSMSRHWESASRRSLTSLSCPSDPIECGQPRRRNSQSAALWHQGRVLCHLRYLAILSRQWQRKIMN